jgi:beta-glucosidase-like glycosyl hydrolase
MCASPLLQSILRDTWKFDGYVVSDCSAVYYMVTQKDKKEKSRGDEDPFFCIEIDVFMKADP